VTAPASPTRQATSLFQERFGSRPTVLVSAPGRVNLIGEHTDYNGGPVLPLAIERRTVVAAARARGWSLASTLDGPLRRVDPGEDKPEGWLAYAWGVIRVLEAERLAPPGARIGVGSSVPVGAGLSSSAALAVSLTRALLVLAGRRLNPRDVAELAYRAEHDEVGVGCGRMDQTVVARARRGHALYFDTETREVKHLPLDIPVWILETGVVHRLVGGRLDERRRECETALQLVQQQGYRVTQLAQVDPADLGALSRALPAPFASRVQHVVTEVRRTRAAAAALAHHQYAELGRLLFEGHLSLRDHYQSSCAEADCLVREAEEAGAMGARLTGAGWGGAVIAILPPGREAGALARIQERFRKAFGRLPTAWVTRAAPGLRSER